MSEKRLVNICNGLYGRVWLNGTSLFQAKSFSLELKLELEKIVGYGDNALENAYYLKGWEASGKFKVDYADSMDLSNTLETMKSGKMPTFSIQEELGGSNQYKGQKEVIYAGECWLEGLPLADWEGGKQVEKEYSFKANPKSINVVKEIIDESGIKIANSADFIA